MAYGQLAAAGTAAGILGIVIGQAWLVGGVVFIVAGSALLIRYRFRRGRTPQDL